MTKGRGRAGGWRGRGGGRSASKYKAKRERQELAKREALVFLRALPAEQTVIAYTDGGCDPNPGPAGAGALVDFPMHVRMLPTPQSAFTKPDSRTSLSSESVVECARGERECGESKREPNVCSVRRRERSEALGYGTNNIGELMGVRLACQMIESAAQGIREADDPPVSQAIILSDSRYVKGQLIDGHATVANRDLVRRVRQIVENCRRAIHPVPLILRWVPAHVGLDGNERADALATRGVHGNAYMAFEQSVAST